MLPFTQSYLNVYCDIGGKRNKYYSGSPVRKERLCQKVFNPSSHVIILKLKDWGSKCYIRRYTIHFHL